jgi:hypothetical protein
MRSAWRRAARALLFAAGGLALGAVALALAVPVVVDQARIRAQLQERLSARVHGTMTWEGLHLRLLPAPHGVLEQPRLEIPGLLAARASRLEARVLLWPLLQGRVEVASLTAVEAQVRLELAQGPAAAPGGAAVQVLDPVATYRALAGAAARAVHAFAPDTQLTIERGGLELHLPGLPPLNLQALDLRARSGGAGVNLQLTCASEHWKRLALDAGFAYADLSGRASLDVEDMDLRAWIARAAPPTGARLAIAPVQLRASLDTDGANALTGRVEASTRSALLAQGGREFEVPAVAVKAAVRAGSQRVGVQLEELRLANDKLLEGGLEYAYASGDTLGNFAFDLDAARALGLVRRVLAKGNTGGLADIESADGTLRGDARLARTAGRWRAGLQLRDSEAGLQLRPLPWPVRVRSGSVEWEPGRMGASAIQGSLGRSRVAEFSARLRMEKDWRVESASASASLDLDQLYPWARQLPALVEPLRGISAVGGELDVELLKASGRLAAPEFEARLAPRSVRLEAEALPGALSLDGGAARITRSAASFQQIALGMLDAKAIASGSVAGIGSRDLRVQAKLSGGSGGPEAVAWVLARANAPSQLALRTPFAFEAERLDWGPGQRLESSARIRFDQATSAALQLSWQPRTFDLRRLEVRAAQGDSALALRTKGRLVEGRFDGSMHGAVLAYFLKDAARYSGRIEGDLRFAADLDRLRNARVAGRLSGEGLDFTWLAGRPLRVEKFAIEADGDTMRIGEATVRSGEDAATLRGELRRGEQGPVVDASIESEGIVVDRLLALAEPGSAQPRDTPAAKTLAVRSAGSPAERADEPGAEPEFAHLWPLPVTGRVALRAGFLQWGNYRIAPVALALNLEAERARLDVEQAQLCGIALPFTVEARRDAWAASARIAAPRQPVGEMMRCLTGEYVQITGDADLQFELKTRGRGRDLVRNLEGAGRIEARDGRIQKFALIGNILALLDIQDAPQAAQDVASGAQGFRYRRIAAQGRLRDGVFTLEEGAFESPSAGMAANGSVRLADGDTNMTVLVAPLGRVDRVVRGIPLVGYVIGGTLTSIPVRVSGDIRSPVVVPLSPRAVTKELLGIFERTLKLPGRLVEPPVRQ